MYEGEIKEKEDGWRDPICVIFWQITLHIYRNNQKLRIHVFALELIHEGKYLAHMIAKFSCSVLKIDLMTT